MTTPTPSDHRRLAEAAITQGLVDAETLSEPVELSVPDKYELGTCLGRGGFGVVYQARDRDLDRTVALKFLIGAGIAEIERFRREARFAARLNDPAIVQVYEFAENDGHPYIAMQYLDGGHLGTADHDERMILSCVRRVAEALGRAHAAGIVHRDVKPANILLDTNGRAYLADFGIARQAADPSATLSHEGIIVGTPALMAPEQARGDIQAVDARADIYALGASMYCLLCKRYPFERATLVDVLHAVLHDDPPLPRSLNPTIPRAVEAIILKCMRKGREQRYQSIAELLTDLDLHRGGQQIPSESEAWFRRLVGATPPPPVPEPDLFERVGIPIVHQLAEYDAHLYRISRNVPRLYPRLDDIIDRLEHVLNTHPHFAWARFYRGLALARRGHLGLAIEELERSIDRVNNQPWAQFEMGRLYLKQYLRDQRRAFKHFSLAGVEFHIADVRTGLERAVIAFEEARRLRYDLPKWQIDYTRAVSALAERNHAACVAICDDILADDPDIGDVWRLRGDALRLNGQDPCDSYTEAIGIRRSDHESLLALAETHIADRAFDIARSRLEQVLALYPGHAQAHAMIARSFLAEVQAPKSDTDMLALFDHGLQATEDARKSDTHNYEAAVTRAELLLERTRRRPAIGDADGALAALRHASLLDGCQNRVNFLTASTHLERARIARGLGEDPRADLEAVLRFKDADIVAVPDHGPWRSLFDDAASELQALD